MSDDDSSINLCRTCRNEYYMLHPEPPIDIAKNAAIEENECLHREHITKSTTMDYFKLSEVDLSVLDYIPACNPFYRSAGPMRLYDLVGVHEYARRVHGGEVGIEAMRDKTRRYRAALLRRREERAELLRQQRDARRAALEARFHELKLNQTLVQWDVNRYINDESISMDVCVELARVRHQRREELRNQMTSCGYELDERSAVYESYVTYGKPALQDANHRLIGEIMEKRAREQRRTDLNNALVQNRLKLEARSTLCQNYISSGTGTVDHIVQVLLEMDWFERETDYLRHRIRVLDWSYVQDEFRNRQPFGKWYALNGYLTKRMQNYIWHDVEVDEDTPARPPRSLWPLIRRMMPEIWTHQANDYIAAGFFSNESNLIEAVREDPDTYSKSITDEFLIKAMDDGLLTLRKSSEKCPSEPPETSFTSAMREAFGEEQFEQFLGSARKMLMEEIMSNFIKGVSSRLPTVIQEWVDGNQVGAALTVQRFDEDKETFIREKIPEVSKETDIHPTYLVAVLNSLKSPLGYNRYYRC